MNNFLENKSLAVFFTRGLSFVRWDKLGMFEREIKIYQALSKEFKEIYFFSYGNDEKYHKLFSENVKIVSKPKFVPSLFYSFLIPFIHYRILKNIDILKTNQMDGSWSAVITKKLFRNKLVIRCGYEWLNFIEISNRPLWKRFFAKIVENFSYKNANIIIQTSKGAIDFLIKRFEIDSNKIFLIPNYVNIDFFTPQYVVKEAGRIIVVGRLEPQKNLFNLIEAVQGLSVNLVFVGEGSQREDLEIFAKTKGVKVCFMGKLPQSDIVKELSISEIYAIPSIYEGHPKALLEAMSCGLACVGSNIPGINDTIADGQDGIICGTDVESINHSIKLLICNRELREKIGLNARKKILEKFSLEKIISRERELYKLL